MNHHLAKTYRRRRTMLALFILIIIFFFALQKGLLSGTNTFFSRIFTPFWVAQNFTSDYLSTTLSSKKDLWKQNTLLRKKIDELELQIKTAGNLRAENEELKSIMGKVPPGTEIVLAGILAKPNTTPYDTLIIDRGSIHGLAPDMRVYADGDVLLGEIDSVEEKTARVLLYSAPGNISQVVYGNTGRFFNARGEGNGTFEVEVARDIDVAVGDMFFYPGLETTIIGVVKKVDFDARDSFKKVLMKSPVNIQEERWVEVRI